MHRSPYHFDCFKELTFDSFLLVPWYPFQLPQRLPDHWSDGYYTNVFQLRAIKLQSYLTTRKCFRYSLQVRYIDLLSESPVTFLTYLNKKFNIPLKKD